MTNERARTWKVSFVEVSRDASPAIDVPSRLESTLATRLGERAPDASFLTKVTRASSISSTLLTACRRSGNNVSSAVCAFEIGQNGGGKMKDWKPPLIAIASLVAVALGTGCASSRPDESEAPQGDDRRHEVPERWHFTFDAGDWHLAHQAATAEQAIREYVQEGETVHDWRTLVTSHFINISLSPREFYQRGVSSKAATCPSFKHSLIEETPDGLIFEQAQDGCPGYPAEQSIQRVSAANPGILTLTFAQKGKLSHQQRDTWLPILRDATVTLAPEQTQRSNFGQNYRSLTRRGLGPLPANESSAYAETYSSGIAFSFREHRAQFVVMLSAKASLPPDAYLEAYFPDPEDINNLVAVGKARRGADKLLITSPEFGSIKCWNYQVVVNIYSDASKAKPLGIHHQSIQSRVDFDRAKTAESPLQAVSSGNCP
jgi:hypothetical protein